MSTMNKNRRIPLSETSRRSSSDKNNVFGKPGGEGGGVSSAATAKKRPALSNITNKQPTHRLDGSSKLVPCSSKSVSINKGPSTASFSNGTFFTNNTHTTSKTSLVATVKGASSKGRDAYMMPKVNAPLASLEMDISPVHSDNQSESMDESMSTCDSLNSPDVEYLDNNEITEVGYMEKKSSSKLCISEHVEAAGNVCKREILAEKEPSDGMMDIDDDVMDPQMCATIACDIYKHLRSSEENKRPSTDFMERVQKDINASMRGILIDWLVEVAEEYRLVPDTLYLTVNYIDRYLSGNVMDRQRLQLLGIACMMIASKYEEICAPQVEEFCYITDNTYFKEEVLQMESDVLNYLKFEMTAPTTKCFLRRFIRAAQGVDEPRSLEVECLSNYVAELSLLDYNMLRYIPSLIAASSIFLARYILCPSKRPWNSTLKHYTLYHPSGLHGCVMALHRLTCGSPNSSSPAIREKYSQHKYKFVAKKFCPPSIPQEYFQDALK